MGNKRATDGTESSRTQTNSNPEIEPNPERRRAPPNSRRGLRNRRSQVRILSGALASSVGPPWHHRPALHLPGADPLPRSLRFCWSPFDVFSRGSLGGCYSRDRYPVRRAAHIIQPGPRGRSGCSAGHRRARRRSPSSSPGWPPLPSLHAHPDQLSRLPASSSVSNGLPSSDAAVDVGAAEIGPRRRRARGRSPFGSGHWCRS